MVKNMAADGARQNARMAGRRKDVGTHIPPAHRTMNDIEYFLNALSAFAKLSPTEQQQLISDIEFSNKSTKHIHSVRLLFSDAIDGYDDEEITDALRND
jgi:hypothetical protein